MRNVAPFIRRPVALTPLIDVIFLLLLFFMLSSTFSKFGEIELRQAAPGASAPSTVEDRVFVQLGADRLTLNGADLSLDDLSARIEAGQVLVSLDADTSSQRLVDLLVRLRGREDLSVTVLE
ncbi:biopolymer transporter ExbD [Tropicimonas sp. TH_r6]|uniref:ExbD/TolR family protein n=1 Tax=Tropicimonas sp. TH_r6 TaxID=3082085 RepID=UPI0029547940|nr:biopolymer transporter ExbD [Tropicimonas sp. TH_r6]MDV7145235.1 biopolymer transporter ExbD [Tropicimonas sp. TH_r6]